MNWKLGRPKEHNAPLERIWIETPTRQALKRMRGQNDDRKIRMLLRDKVDLVDDLEWARDSTKHQEDRYDDLKDRINFQRNNPQFPFVFGPCWANRHLIIGASFSLVTYTEGQALRRPTYNYKCGCDSCKKGPYFGPEELARIHALETGKLSCETCGAVASDAAFSQKGLFGNYCKDHIEKGREDARKELAVAV